MNSVYFIMVGKYQAFSPALMLFCFYLSDETEPAFQFGCSTISVNLKYLWKRSVNLRANLILQVPSTGDLFLNYSDL